MKMIPTNNIFQAILMEQILRELAFLKVRSPKELEKSFRDLEGYIKCLNAITLTLRELIENNNKIK